MGEPRPPTTWAYHALRDGDLGRRPHHAVRLAASPRLPRSRGAQGRHRAGRCQRRRQNHPDVDRARPSSCDLGHHHGARPRPDQGCGPPSLGGRLRPGAQRAARRHAGLGFREAPRRGARHAEERGPRPRQRRTVARRTRRRTLPGTRHHVDRSAPAGEARPGDRRRSFARAARRTDRRSRSRPARRNAGPDPSDQRRVRHRCPPVESPPRRGRAHLRQHRGARCGTTRRPRPLGVARRRHHHDHGRTRRDRRAPRRRRCGRGGGSVLRDSTSVAISTSFASPQPTSRPASTRSATPSPPSRRASGESSSTAPHSKICSRRHRHDRRRDLRPRVPHVRRRAGRRRESRPLGCVAHDPQHPRARAQGSPQGLPDHRGGRRLPPLDRFSRPVRAHRRPDGGENFSPSTGNSSAFRSSQ